MQRSQSTLQRTISPTGFNILILREDIVAVHTSKDHLKSKKKHPSCKPTRFTVHSLEGLPDLHPAESLPHTLQRTISPTSNNEQKITVNQGRSPHFKGPSLLQEDYWLLRTRYSVAVHTSKDHLSYIARNFKVINKTVAVHTSKDHLSYIFWKK